MTAELAQYITEAPVADGRAIDHWPKPRTIRAPLGEVAAFDGALLPEALRPRIMDVAHRMQCPPDYVAVAAMVGLATVVGRRIQIRPKRQDDWTVTPNLWGMIVGRPSALKSPAMEEMMKPLHRLESLQKESHDALTRNHEKEKRIFAAREKASAAKLMQAFKKGDDEATDDLPEPPKPPPRRRIVTVDATVEKLGELLRDNPRGMLVYRDELAGWFASFERDGRETDRTFYLTAWQGNSPFRYDRIGRGTVDMEAVCLSILGTIQPGVLIRHISEALRGTYNDGLVQRFQLMVYPDDVADWSYVDQWPDAEAKERAFGVFRKLDETDATLFGATIADDDETSRILRFDEAAQETFKDWLTKLETKLRDSDDHPIVSEHLGKYRKLMPAVAGLVHLANVAGGCAERGNIGINSAMTAIAWCDYLEGHARRLYGSALARGTTAARLLASKIRKGKLRDGFTARDVYSNEWSGLATPDDAQRAIETLEDLDWLQCEAKHTGGRPKQVYRINPRLAELDDSLEEEAP